MAGHRNTRLTIPSRTLLPSFAAPQGDLDGRAGRASLGAAAQPRAAARQGLADPVAASRQWRSLRGGALDVDGLPRVQRGQQGATVSLRRLDRRPAYRGEDAGMPAYVGLPHTHSVGIAPGYHGAAYLGSSYNPFNADGDPSSEHYRVPNLTLPLGVNSQRLDSRRCLRALDHTRRDFEASGIAEGFDRFEQEAFSMVLGHKAREAFDLKKEDPRLRDRYSRHQWGQSALLARRLVEAGVRYVTLTFGGWDFHSSLESGMHRVLPILDATVGTLIEDLENRGLLDSTIVIVMGEFGRTPRMNKRGVPGSDPVPGRDHWGNVMSVLVAGGGFARGQIVGASNRRGERPTHRPVRPARPDRHAVSPAWHRSRNDVRSTASASRSRSVPNGQLISELVG